MADIQETWFIIKKNYCFLLTKCKYNFNDQPNFTCIKFGYYELKWSYYKDSVRNAEND